MTAYASLTFSELMSEPTSTLMARLLKSDAVSGFTQVSHEQQLAWAVQIDLLRDSGRQLIDQFPAFAGFGLVLEYRIPRREKRIDAVVLMANSVIVIEFKVGGKTATTEAVEQVSDYALDLVYYHGESQDRRIVPLLCPTETTSCARIPVGRDTPIEDIRCCGKTTLAALLLQLAQEDQGPVAVPLSVQTWSTSAYRPIPGMIEATVQLFAGHRVHDINSTLADNDAIEATVARVREVIADAQGSGTKILCLVTGVPGAGKTLTGLQIVHSEVVSKSGWNSVFLSGNGPLLKVLRAALARDYAQRQRCTQVMAKSHASALLHSVHSYLAESLKANRPPTDQVVIFDEAQRAWDGNKMEKMAKHQHRVAGGVPDESLESFMVSSHSEPHQILSILDRHPSGAVIVALCGNGQEIHDGEAGVEEWTRARAKGFPHWKLLCSHVTGHLTKTIDDASVQVDHRLHLSVPIRTHRASAHAQWVDAVLNGDADQARNYVDHEQFPIRLTRDRDDAHIWLRSNSQGSRRFGLLASSSATRLRPYGVEVSADFRKAIDYPAWFTADRADLRSSYALEVAATEFECQGLELDRVCVCWCWDLLVQTRNVQPRVFRTSKWVPVKGQRERDYALNKYRVLLTRAREGMVIWVPKGTDYDSTRSSDESNAIFEYLLECGCRPL